MQPSSSSSASSILSPRDRGADGRMQFTARKCPPGPGLENCCEVPFGFLWTPLAASRILAATANHGHDDNANNDEERIHDAVPVVPCVMPTAPSLKHSFDSGNDNDSDNDNREPDRGQDCVQPNAIPPILCITCLSYLNMYADLQMDTKRWTCSVCGSANVLPEELCAKMPSSSLPLSTDSSASPSWHAVLSSPVYEIHQPLLPITTTNNSTAEAACDISTVILVVEENLPSAEAMAVGMAVQSYFQNCKHDNDKTEIHLGLIVFGKNVHIYQMGLLASTSSLSSSSSSSTTSTTTFPLVSADVYATPDGLTQDLLLQRNYIMAVTQDNQEQAMQALRWCLQAAFHLDPTMTAADAGGDSKENGSGWDTKDKSASTTTTTTGDAASKALSPRMQMLQRRRQERLQREQQQQQAQQQQAQLRPLKVIVATSSTGLAGATALEPITGSTVTTPIVLDASALSPWLVARQAVQATRRPLRCTGEALQCGMELATLTAQQSNSNNRSLSELSPRSGRIFLFSAGCPNFGEGTVVASNSQRKRQQRRRQRHRQFVGTRPNPAQTGGITNNSTVLHPYHFRRKHYGADVVDTIALLQACPYYDAMGRLAAEHGIGIDVFLTGQSELAMSAYQALVEPSSGYVVTHDSFTTDHVAHNLQFVWQQTYMPVAANYDKNDLDNEVFDEEDEENKEDHPKSIWKNQHGCLLDIRAPGYVDATHLVGPGDLVESEEQPDSNKKKQRKSKSRWSRNKNNPRDAGILDTDDFLVLPPERAAFAAGVALATAAGLLKPSTTGNKSTSRGSSSRKGNTSHRLPNRDWLDSSLTRIRLGRCDPLSTISVMLRLNQFFQENESHATFQCTARYVDRSGQFLVTRVCTQRLAVAQTVSAFLDAVDEDVVPALLGKEAVYRSMFGREVEDHDLDAVVNPIDTIQLERLAYEAQRDLDATIQCISSASRLLGLEQGTRSLDMTEEGGMKATGSSIDFTFPPELADGLRRLYHLRRGPLLSPGPLQSMDDRAEMRSLFIRLPLDDCLNMMAPNLWTTGPLRQIPPVSADDVVANLELIPSDTLALWENCILVADHFDRQFLWSGRAVSGDEFQHVREQLQAFLLDRAQHRFPLPKFYISQEGDSMSRRFTALLAPSHGDPLEHQVAHFPALSQLSPDEQSKLRSKFLFYDPTNDPSFRSWFWDVASTTSRSKYEGISLCD